MRLVLRESSDRVMKKVASAPKQSIAAVKSEADENVSADWRYFQARPTRASPKEPDAKKMALRARSA